MIARYAAIAMALILPLGAIAENEQVQEDPIPHAHYPQSFPDWGASVNEISLSIYLKPVPGEALPNSNLYLFNVCVRNDSDKPFYFVDIGVPTNGVKLRASDGVGHTFILGDKLPRSTFAIDQIAPHDHLVLYVGLTHEQLAAIGNSPLVAVVDLLQMPTPKDPATPRFTVESLPFVVYPKGPDRTPFPADPVHVQIELEAARLKEKVENATSPEDRSEAAQRLAFYDINERGKPDEVRDLLPLITDPVDRCDVQLSLIFNDTTLPTMDKIAQLHALAMKYPDHDFHLQHYVGGLQYQEEHPEKYLP